MKYVKFTHIDAVTGVPVTTSPATNGPAFPVVDGLEFVWARESEYPTAAPHLFGTCPDDSNTDAPGVLGVFSQEDWDSMHANEAVQMFKINRERDVARITVTTTSGKVFDGDETSQNRLARAIVALQAAGVQSTNWKLADNTQANVPVAELAEALILAGLAQTAVWMG